MPGLAQAYTHDGRTTVIDLDAVREEDWIRLKQIWRFTVEWVPAAALYFQWLVRDPAGRWFFAGYLENDPRRGYLRAFSTPCEDYVQASPLNASSVLIKDKIPLPPELEVAAREEAKRPRSGAEGEPAPVPAPNPIPPE